jgi:hypothetical protein
MLDAKFPITIYECVLAGLVVIFCACERYPISVNATLGDQTLGKQIQLKEQAGF